MQRISKRKSSKKTVAVVPGIFPAVVTDVTNSEDFDEGDSIDVTYDVDVNGSIIKYSERFYIRMQNDPRIKGFEKHLDELGVDDYVEYIGTRLTLTFLKQVRNGRAFVNIVERQVMQA